MLSILNKIIFKKKKKKEKENENKKLLYLLTKIYGINKSRSKKIFQKFGINPLIKIKNLNSNQLNTIINYIKKRFKIEDTLRILKKKHIVEKYVESKNCRGMRIMLGFPIRGQRTHSNAKTSKKLRFVRNEKSYRRKNIAMKKPNYSKRKHDRKKNLKKK